MAKRKEKRDTPRVHPDLEGFNIEVNSFGEVKTNYDLDKLNLFLNRNVKDKKFKGREDIAGVPDEFRTPTGAHDEDDDPTQDPGRKTPDDGEDELDTPPLRWGETQRDEATHDDADDLPPALRDMDSEQDLDDLSHER